MHKDEIRLIFETERRILERRLGRLLRRKPREPEIPIQSGDSPRDGKHPRPPARELGEQRDALPPDPTRKPREIPWGTRLFHAVLSIAIHATLLAMILPIAFVNPKPEPYAHRPLIVRWQPPEPVRQPVAPPVAPPATTAKPPPLETTVAKSEDTPPATAGHEETDTARAAPPAEEPEGPKSTPAVLGLGAGDPSAVASRGGGGSLGGRGGDHQPALRRFGGNAETELAVREGLAWLARHQDSDGSWDPAGFHRHCRGAPPCVGRGFAEFRTGVTALCVLAFLGAGIDGQDDAALHGSTVRNGLAFLLAAQDDGGCFGRHGNKYMYNHALGTFCAAEAYLLTRDLRYKNAAERGLLFSAATQQPGGGWDYTSARTLRNDLSITGWQVMALRTARDARISFPPEMSTAVMGFVERAVHADGLSTYADIGIGAGRQGISIAAVGLLSKLYLDWSPRGVELAPAAERIVRRPPNVDERADWERRHQSSYYWYYATLALFHMGGERWDAWNVLLRREVLPLQYKDGEARGSWDPDPNWIGAESGRVAVTALNVLTFEIYYRYEPLHLKHGLADPPAKE